MMAHGQTKGKVDPQFQKRILDLETKAREQSEQFRRQSTPRPWHTPETMKNTDLLDVPNLHEPAWNRDKLNERYSSEILTEDPESRGTQGDIIATKMQIDFMAEEERAWRLRHATPARCAAVAHGRLSGHGIANQGVFSRLEKTVDKFLIVGGFTGENV
jgi:hypothetical protein